MTTKEKKALYDQYGDLKSELAPLQYKISAMEKCRKAIVALHEDEPADQPCAAEGDRWLITMTPRTMQRVFKPGALKKLSVALGKRFWAICTVGLGKFEEEVTLLDRSKYVEEQQTGHRTLEAIAKPDALKNAA